MIRFSALLITICLLLRDSAITEGKKLRDEDDEKDFHFITQKPFPTVSYLSYSENNKPESTNSKVFKGLVIVLASIVAIAIFYYCRKFCQCRKACTSMPTSPNSPKSKRNLRNVAHNARISPYVIRYQRGYQRMTSEGSPHSHRRAPRRIAEVHAKKKKTNSASKSPERPPDYSTVILNDLAKEQIEIPIPEQEESPDTPSANYDEKDTFK